MTGMRPTCRFCSSAHVSWYSHRGGRCLQVSNVSRGWTTATGGWWPACTPLCDRHARDAYGFTPVAFDRPVEVT